MHQAVLRQATSVILGWPLSGHERMARDAAADALLRAEVGGVLGTLSPDEKERLRGVVTSMSGFVQEADIEDAQTGGHWRPWGQPQHFMLVPGLTAADSVRRATFALWSYADEAVFWHRRGETLRSKSSLGRALHALQDSFSPAHVRRVLNDEGIFVIADVFEYTKQDHGEHAKGDQKFKSSEKEESEYTALGQATVAASALLLGYFLSRAAGRETEAAAMRKTIEDRFLHEGLA